MAPQRRPSGPAEKLSPAQAAQLQQQFDEAIEHAVDGGRIQERAKQTRKRAQETEDADERAALEQEAKALDAQAKQQLQTTKRLQDGVWQGFGVGAGIGAGSGMALGTATGILLGGILAVPTTAVGALIGAGAGAVHGPWVKLTRGKEGPEIEEAKPGEPGAIELKPGDLDTPLPSPEAVEKTSKGNILTQTRDGLAGSIPTSFIKRNQESKATSAPPRPLAKRGGSVGTNSQQPGRKPPKKLEIRGDTASQATS